MRIAAYRVRSREASPAPPAADQPRGLRQWWLDRSLRTKGLIVVAVPLIALMGVTAANLLLQQNQTDERNVSINARNLASAASQVLADAVNAETGVRGYAATRDPLFLDPYNLTLTRIGAERRSLREAAVMTGDVRQQQQVDATTGKVLFELAQLRSAISRGISIGNLAPRAGEPENHDGPAAPPGRQSRQRPHGRGSHPARQDHRAADED